MVVVAPVAAVVEVTGMHGTVVVTGLFGMQNGRVVDVLVVVGPIPAVVEVVGAGVVVVVTTTLVVVVPGPGPPVHPNDCSSELSTAATAGNPAKAGWSDRMVRQIGSRKTGSI